MARRGAWLLYSKLCCKWTPKSGRFCGWGERSGLPALVACTFRFGHRSRVGVDDVKRRYVGGYTGLCRLGCEGIVVAWHRHRIESHGAASGLRSAIAQNYSERLISPEASGFSCVSTSSLSSISYNIEALSSLRHHPFIGAGLR
jgi:hypothetical protein